MIVEEGSKITESKDEENKTHNPQDEEYKIHNPHDKAFFKSVENLEIARDALQAYLPPEILEQLSLHQETPIFGRS